MAAVSAHCVPTLAAASPSRGVTRPSRSAPARRALPLALHRAALPQPLPAAAGPRLPPRGEALLFRASSDSEEAQTESEEAAVGFDVAQFFGSYFFLAVFLGTMGLAAFASFKIAMVDPAEVGILAGPPSAFMAVALSFFAVKIVQNKQKQAKRAAKEQQQQ
mmetsp:Transcript_45571/g.116581  ORF Transcript_45571/g.116581 Transcript_45571/m.116581 type:complete len:162 (+) Transcript_45571:102-587(+)